MKNLLEHVVKQELNFWLMNIDMSAKPTASTESQGCPFFINFNAFYSELQNEVQPVFTDQSTRQINTQPGNGCACFQYPFVNNLHSQYSHANRNPTEQLSHANGLSLLASGSVMGLLQGVLQREWCKTNVVIRKVSDSLIVTVKQLLIFRFRYSKYKLSCSGCIQKECKSSVELSYVQILGISLITYGSMQFASWKLIPTHTTKYMYGSISGMSHHCGDQRTDNISVHLVRSQAEAVSLPWGPVSYWPALQGCHCRSYF